MVLNRDKPKLLVPSLFARDPTLPVCSGSVYRGAVRGAHAIAIERPSVSLMGTLITIVIAMILSLLIASPAFGQHGGHGGHGGFGHGGFGHGGFGHGGVGHGGFGHGRFGHGGFGLGHHGFSLGGFGHHSGGHHTIHLGFDHHDHGHHGGLHFGGFAHRSGYGNAYYYANPYYYSYGYPRAYGYPSAYSGYPSGYSSYVPSYAYNRYEAPPPAEVYPPIDRHEEAAADATTRPRRERPTGVERDGRGGSAMEKGLTLLKQGAYQRATDVLLQAVLSDPEAGLPKLAFADALFATGDYDYAAYAVRRGIDRVSDIAVVLADRRSLFRDDKELDRLVYRLRHHVQRHSRSTDAHFLLGYYHLIMGRPEDARRSFDTALDLDSHDRHALVLRDLAKGHEPARP